MVFVKKMNDATWFSERSVHPDVITALPAISVQAHSSKWGSLILCGAFVGQPRETPADARVFAHTVNLHLTISIDAHTRDYRAGINFSAPAKPLWNSNAPSNAPSPLYFLFLPVVPRPLAFPEPQRRVSADSLRSPPLIQVWWSNESEATGTWKKLGDCVNSGGSGSEIG